ncbi:MAG TPA: cytochrome c [Candidatus Acidoferrum sp.]
MPKDSANNLGLRKLIFVALLLAAAAAIIFALVQDLPWHVPEAAKQVQNPLPPSEAEPEATRALYQEKCANCHGDTGRGDGREASQHFPAPTDFSDPKRTASDGELFYKISEGKRPMPSFKKRLTERQRWQLVFLLRSFSSH